MKLENKYKILAKIIGSLLVVLVIVTIIYSATHFDKYSISSIKDDEPKIYTKIFKVSDLCNEGESCARKNDVQFTESRTVNINYGRTIIDGEMTENKIYIDDAVIELPENVVIKEFGILKSRYFVVSYVINNETTFYYVDEALREVKRVEKVSKGTEIGAVEYNYDNCKNKMKILENGTFISKVIDGEDSCE